MRFVIAAGGTGGHLFPGLAVGEVLLARGHEVMVLISEKEIDALATQGRTEFRIERLPGIGMPKLLSPAMVGFLFRFSSGLARCRSLFREFQPAAILGMGGFTSTAPILAGRFRKLPTFVHESNVVPGRANRLNARLVSSVLLGFSEATAAFPKTRCEVTGTPVRKTLIRRLPREEALTAFGLSPERKTLLVMGGSQGAQGINRALTGAAALLKDLPLQVIHLSGAADEAATRSAYEAVGVPAFVAPFFHRMEEAYSAADLAVSRSGAASITELSYFGIPSILIPYPFAADDHQTANARVAEAAGAAILLSERDAAPGAFANQLRALLGDGHKLGQMSAAAQKLGGGNAAERVANVLLTASTEAQKGKA